MTMSMQGSQRQTAHFILKPFVNQVGPGNRFEFVNENRRVSRFLLQFLETGDMVAMCVGKKNGIDGQILFGKELQDRRASGPVSKTQAFAVSHTTI